MSTLCKDATLAPACAGDRQESPDSAIAPQSLNLPARLNQECFCITLDRAALRRALESELGDAELCEAVLAARPHLFSNSPVFLSSDEIAAMLRIVHAVEAAAALPGYREAVLSWAPPIARHDPGPLGVFMGYDFHLATDGPKLIEVNTNAGGAFLNAVLAQAQQRCCIEVDIGRSGSSVEDFDEAVWRMFEKEWRLQRRTDTPRHVAIVDDQPEEQYLYPEFLLARRFFVGRGLQARLADAAALRYERGRLCVDDQPIDLVYNRLVDFALERPEHAALRAAFLDDAVVLTPHPRVHALLADKRNLAVLGDEAALGSWGLAPGSRAALAGVPRTVLVTAENAADLWAARKGLFFKPAGGHGSKAVYRGDKLTRRVWSEIIATGRYIAQEFAAPSERMIELDGVVERRKIDVRLYVYDGGVLLVAARLYQGQTTNFRTAGGGFAPVLVLPGQAR